MYTLQLGDPVELAPEKRPIAARISARLQEPRAPRLVLGNGEEVELPAEFLLLLREIATALARGEPVSVVPLHRELTTQEAADVLNISRQHVVNLMEDGKLPFTRTGRHRRVLAAEVLAFKRRREADRRQALRDLTQMGEDAGDYFSDVPKSLKRLDE